MTKLVTWIFAIGSAIILLTLYAQLVAEKSILPPELSPNQIEIVKEASKRLSLGPTSKEALDIYDSEDIDYVLNILNIDWQEQAIKVANSLEASTCSMLIYMLEKDYLFPLTEATYAGFQTPLCTD